MTRGRGFVNASMDFGAPSTRSLPCLSEISPLLLEEQGGPIFISDALPKVRLDFLSKIYALLSLQFLVSTGICAFFMHYEPIRSFMDKYYHFMIIASAIVSFASLVHLLMNVWVSGNNVVPLFTFTMCQSTLFGSICVAYADNGLGFLIIESLATSTIAFAGFTVYAAVSRWDFAYSAAATYALVVFVAVCSIANGSMECIREGTALVATAFLFTTSTMFTLFILYDSKFFNPVLASFCATSLCHTSRTSVETCLLLNHVLTVLCSTACFALSLFRTAYMLIEELGPDDVVPGAVMLYTDLLSLCLQVLSVLSNNPDK